MFARPQRLRKNTDIIRTYRRGKRFAARHLKINYLANPRGGLRVAVVISKKIDKRAVARNRAKRRVRELLRDEIKAEGVKGFDILITVLAAVEEMSVVELRAEVRQLVKRIEG